MIGPLWLCFSWEIFTSISIKPETCFYTSTPLENKIDKSTGSMCKTRDVKGWNEKVTNRRDRAFIQKIITPFSSSSPSGNPTLLFDNRMHG